jgi:hypothetical protein
MPTQAQIEAVINYLGIVEQSSDEHIRVSLVFTGRYALESFISRLIAVADQAAREGRE